MSRIDLERRVADLEARNAQMEDALMELAIVVALAAKAELIREGTPTEVEAMTRELDRMIAQARGQAAREPSPTLRLVHGEEGGAG